MTSSSANLMSAALTAGAALAGAVAVMAYIKKKSKHSVMVTLPHCAAAAWEEYSLKKFTTDEEMMSLAILLSDKNITEDTGGPFGTAIFERHEDKDGKSYCTLASIGMNRVVPLGNSTLHGEVRFFHTRATLLTNSNSDNELSYKHMSRPWQSKWPKKD